MRLYSLILIFFEYSFSVYGAPSLVPICGNVTLNVSVPVPTAVVIYEIGAEDTSIDDIKCTINKVFKTTAVHQIPAGKTRHQLCYSVAMAPILVDQILVVIHRHHNLTFECQPAVYGPLPDILAITLPIRHKDHLGEYKRDLAVNVNLTTKGGRLAIDVEYNKARAIPTWNFVLSNIVNVHNSMKTAVTKIPKFHRFNLIRTANPLYHEEYVLNLYNSLLAKGEQPIWIAMTLACLPIILMASIVSGFLIMQPRGGLTYVTEDIECTIIDVEEEAMDDVEVKTAYIPVIDEKLPARLADEDVCMTQYEDDLPVRKESRETVTARDSSVDVKTAKEGSKESKDMGVMLAPEARTQPVTYPQDDAFDVVTARKSD